MGVTRQQGEQRRQYLDDAADWTGLTLPQVAVQFVHRIRLFRSCQTQLTRYDTIRYDTRCYFNVRSKANMSQFNLPHGTDNKKV